MLYLSAFASFLVAGRFVGFFVCGESVPDSPCRPTLLWLIAMIQLVPDLSEEGFFFQLYECLCMSRCQ